ncbi:MAG: cytochrome d ubiquinol oxidase subunit II, partial [Acidobacteriaceae bacterium]|nr:cytochrome d ubiquinol oxidase subunit II [Acidobacteriaceae bacterium]
MNTVWFLLVAFMLVAYVVLDGFDLGTGALYPFITRTEEHRRIVFRAIGPVWDGNEVWLIAAGGTLFFAFPLLYASSFSGFYLPLNMVLWLLIFRAIGIEFRSHVQAPIWREFYGVMFFLASALLIIFFGAALGNVIRGVALNRDHYFFAPLWTDFRVGASPGILDWYTVLCALVSLAVLCMHGALFLAIKTDGELQARIRAIRAPLSIAVALLSTLALAATIYIRPELLNNYRAYPIAWLIPMAVVAALCAIVYFSRSQRDSAAFFASSAYIVLMLSGAAFAVYPTLLSDTGGTNALTIYNAAAGPESLSMGLFWWIPGMLIAIAYFVMV